MSSAINRKSWGSDFASWRHRSNPIFEFNLLPALYNENGFVLIWVILTFKTGFAFTLKVIRNEKSVYVNSCSTAKGEMMAKRERYLSIYLSVFGFASIFLITTIPIIWGNVLLWHPRNLPNEIMIASIYLAMGIIMILIAKKPLAHKSFIDFLILANLFHALIMLVYSRNFIQVIFDVIPIGLMGLIPLIIYPWQIVNFLRGYR